MELQVLVILVCCFSFSVGFDVFQSYNLPEDVNSDIVPTNELVNDAACDRHLAAFSDAFAKREMWALHCKRISKSETTRLIIDFQCLTTGRRSILDI
jgi:hypothetical protein